MQLLEIILFLMLCAVALGWVARHFQFPYPIALVIGGGALGFIPRLPEIPFDPQLILVLVLPPILTAHDCCLAVDGQSIAQQRRSRREGWHHHEPAPITGVFRGSGSGCPQLGRRRVALWYIMP